MAVEEQKTRRQLIDEAISAALEGDWNEAIAANQRIIDRFPRDAEAFNRMGRAHLEERNYSAATEAYTQALRVDKANLIARRNLQRLELLRKSGWTAEPSGSSTPRTSVFIEEVGRTWVDELVNPLPLEQLAQISPGEQLQLVQQGNELIVQSQSGQTLGEIEAKTAERILQLIENGNQYEVYALGLSTKSLRIILREVYRDQRNGGLVSFPRQIAATRAYLRERDTLRARDESEFLLHDEEEEEIEEEESGEQPAEDDETVESDTDGFMDDALQIDDDSNHI